MTWWCAFGDWFARLCHLRCVGSSLLRVCGVLGGLLGMGLLVSGLVRRGSGGFCAWLVVGVLGRWQSGGDGALLSVVRGRSFLPPRHSPRTVSREDGLIICLLGSVVPWYLGLPVFIFAWSGRVWDLVHKRSNSSCYNRRVPLFCKNGSFWHRWGSINKPEALSQFNSTILNLSVSIQF